MPYIKAQARKELAAARYREPASVGELNYAITQELVGYWQRSPMNYQAINDIVGAAESAKAEFYRRVAIPYEETKCAENGDVY